VGVRLLLPCTVLAAALLDAVGTHGAATLALVLAVPLAAVAALQVLDEALRRPRALESLQMVLAVIVLATVLLAAAIRSPLAAANEVPPAAVTALVACLVALGLQALATGAAAFLRRPRADVRRRQAGVSVSPGS
jgi:hypothetical protein